ncbi:MULTISPECIES: hypothetical protein [unclassified Lysinibacillus]
MTKFIDDFSAKDLDVFKLILYFITGDVLVGSPLYVIAKVFEWLF